MSSEGKLLGCPFCGGVALLTEHVGHEHSDVLVRLTGLPKQAAPSWTIECQSCACGLIDDHRDSVVAAWNRRRSASPSIGRVGVPADWSHMPSYGTLPWQPLIEAVAEARVGDRSYDLGLSKEYHIGHQMVPAINFNSLNRIVSAFVAAALASPPDNGEVVEALIEACNQIEYLHGKFQETGSGNAVIAKLTGLRRKLQSARLFA